MSLVRSTLVVSLASGASRVLGFARDVLFAQVLGAGPVADAFLAAFRLPNLLRRVLGEGGLNPVLVPALARLGPTESARFAGEAFAGLSLVLVALVAAIEVLAGIIIIALAPGFADGPDTLALATLLMRLAMPLVIGVTLASLVAAVLNHHRRFVAAALAPLVVNAALIAVLLVLRQGTALDAGRQALWLAGAASLAGLVQFALVGLALIGSEGTPLRPVRPRWSPALRALAATAVPALVAGAAAQLFVLVGTQAASFLPSGLSWLYYADRIAQLPLGIIASAAGVVLLPELAAGLALGRRPAVIASQNRAIEMALLIALPASVALACLATPVTAVLFERGAFGPEDSRGTAAALFGLSLGLPFAVVGKVLSQTLFADGRVRAPLVGVALGVLATAAGSLALSPALGILGVGLGIALGSVVFAGTLVAALRSSGLWAVDAPLVRRIGRVVLASALLATALVPVAALLPSSAWSLTGLCLGGLAFYVAAAWLLGAITPADLALLAKKP
jgi:putative peptidoglycan lipid II flippase